MAAKKRQLLLDGVSLSAEQLVDAAYDMSGNLEVDLAPMAWEAVASGRAVVDRVLQRGEVVYGINTGFGNFSNVLIPPNELKVRWIASHRLWCARSSANKRNRCPCPSTHPICVCVCDD